MANSTALAVGIILVLGVLGAGLKLTGLNADGNWFLFGSLGMAVFGGVVAIARHN